jgi:beta-galactosidase
LHVLWRVPFVAGTIKAVAWKNGKRIQTRSTSTAGKPVSIRLQADRKIVQANGQDAAFVEVQLVDAQGRLVPDADVSITATVSGAASLVGTDNGFQAETVSLKSNRRSTWRGKAVVVLQSSERQGNITVTVKAAGFASNSITLTCQ